MLSHQHIDLALPVWSLDWQGDQVVDPACGRSLPDGVYEGAPHLHYSFGTRFNGARSLQQGRYRVLYERRGTKGLLLKEGEIIREINRSYYHSEKYEYPVALWERASGQVCVIHCPEEYKRLEIEDFETGERLSSQPGRKLNDIFHGYLEVSPNGRYLASGGWVWHPWCIQQVYDLEACVADPRLLDGSGCGPQTDSEIATVHFFGESRLLVLSSFEDIYDPEEDYDFPPRHLGIYDLKDNSLLSKHHLSTPYDLVPVDDTLAWSLDGHVGLFDLKAGKLLETVPGLGSHWHVGPFGEVRAGQSAAMSRDRKQLALASGTSLDIISL